MKIIRPVKVNESNLTSNVAITETEWTAGTYTLGQQRYVGTTLYEVAVASTTDNPEDGINADPPSWIRVGEINRFKMFSGVLFEQTVRANEIDVTIDPQALVNAVALFNLSGSEVTVTVDDPVDGVVYDKTIQLLDNSAVSDWYSYFFSPIERKKDAIFADLPTYVSAEINVHIDAGAEDARCGELVLGSLTRLGITVYGTKVGIVDYSRKERDIFGGAIILERAFSRRVEYDVRIETNSITSVANRLAEIRATPIVYIGSAEDDATVVYGYYRDFGITYSTPSLSRCTIEVEGLV